MPRSTIIPAALVAAALLAPCAAQAELAARPAFAGIRPTIVPHVPRFPQSGIAPTIVGRRSALPLSRGTAPTLVGRARRGGRFDGGGGLGYDGDYTTDAGTSAGAYPDAGPLPPPVVIDAPRPIGCPQIIEIGRGLEHQVHTRVISGPPVCGY